MEVEFNTEHHPNWYFEVPEMKVLILGSYPPHEKRWSYDFYYPNNSNPFWDALAGVKGIELKHYRCDAAVKERQQLMIDMKVGVENLGQIIQREGESAADKDIRIEKFRDIKGILDRHREIEKILLPGFSGKSSTYHGFIRYLREHEIDTFSLPTNVKENETFKLNYEGKEIVCVILNSTSPRNGMNLEDRILQFKEHIKI